MSDKVPDRSIRDSLRSFWRTLRLTKADALAVKAARIYLKNGEPKSALAIWIAVRSAVEAEQEGK